MTLLGELALWVALVMAAWGTIVSFAGGSLGSRGLIASGERAIYATLALLVVASLGLISALLRSDFTFTYVASHTSANLPTPYKLSAFWAGQSGALLFWTLVLAMCAAIAVWRNRGRMPELAPYVAGTLSVVTLFFLLVAAFGANPYERLTWLPPDGRGMNPVLQHPGMTIHPPSLYLGSVATAVPFALTVAALATRRLDGEWLGAVRRWALMSWFFLTIGILVGMWWAYGEVGWGGYRAWDPVENASLLPWLTGTAFLHSVMVQEKRGMLRTLNVTLVIATFLLAVFGTFIARSGMIADVHSFAQSGVGNWYAGFLVAGILVSAYLVLTRRRDLEATAPLESMAIGPQVAWRRASLSNLRRQLTVPVALAHLAARNRRRYGGSIVHVGIVVLVAALAGLAFRNEFDVSLAPGETFRAADPFGREWTFSSNGVSRFQQLNRHVTAVALQAHRAGGEPELITSERRQHVDSRGAPTFEPSTEVGILGTWRQDVYIVLGGVTGDERAQIRLSFNPLVRWVWMGGLIIVIGGLIVMWPQAEPIRDDD